MPTRNFDRSPPWKKALQACADPVRASHVLEELFRSGAPNLLTSATMEHARTICALLSGSQWAGDILKKHPEWLKALPEEGLGFPRRKQGLQREIKPWLAERSETALPKLRQLKQREMLRIAARDLGRLADAAQITQEISSLADVCLDAVLHLALAQLESKLGRPYHKDARDQWVPTEFVVLGLGKLGGEELNYSSDVDLMFVYTEEGAVFRESPRKAESAARAPSSHEFYKRLAQSFIAEGTRQTVDGTLFRIDLRLRPEGDAGPLVRSLPGYENYYAQWGQTWERMMLIKARCTAGSEALAGEFLETVQPFRYPRSLNEGVVREIAAMKERTENEIVKTGEIDRNVKLGRGGIREIEFVAQTLQLLHGGRVPFLQSRQTLAALEKLVEYRFLPRDEGKALQKAYLFLRDVEHRLQMENNLQTHTIPSPPKARQRLARLMGFKTAKQFESARTEHARHVRASFDRLLRPDAPEGKATTTPFPREFAGHEDAWKSLLAHHGFKDSERSLRLLNEFAHGPGFVHVSQRTVDLAFQLLPRVFNLCPNPAAGRVPSRQTVLSDPDRVLARLDSFISAYGTRAMLFEMWAANPSVFELMLLLFDRSEFLAERAIRTPDLVEHLMLSGRLRRRKDTAETLNDLRHGREDADQKLWIRKYHQTELMRIGLREIIGLADLEQHEEELSALAEACLQYAVEVLLRKYRQKSPPFVIVGLGKLGGRELNYGSDLDITFVAANNARDLPKLQRVTAELVDLLTAPTQMGNTFRVDARLRPDGEKGLLVNTLAAYEQYYRHRGQLWELQALLRARAVAGNLKLGGEFENLVASLTNLKGRRDNWKSEIAAMRLRIEKERTPPGQDALAIKTGSGGLIDAEFVAQTACLEHGWREPNTLRALQRAGREGALAPSDAKQLIENYLALRRIEGILRRWSYEGETVLPIDPAPFYRVSVRCGFDSPEKFRDAIATWRKAIRRVYNKFFKLS